MTPPGSAARPIVPGPVGIAIGPGPDQLIGPGPRQCPGPMSVHAAKVETGEFMAAHRSRAMMPPGNDESKVPGVPRARDR